MSADDDLLMARTRQRLDEKRAAYSRARATDAATHLRMAIDLLDPLSRSPDLDRVAELLDEAATLLVSALVSPISVVERNVTSVPETEAE